jgi:hypothetical protein
VQPSNLDTDFGFYMSGGTMRFSTANAANGWVSGIRLEVVEGNYNVTGGNVEVSGLTGTNPFDIYSTIPLYNLSVLSAASDVQVTGWYGGSYNSSWSTNFELLGDLSIASGTTFNDLGHSVYIAGDLDISGAFSRSGELIFNGTQDGAIINQTGGLLTLDGLTINKDRHPTAGSYYNISLTGANNVNINGDITLTRGAFDVVDYWPTVTGDVIVSDGDLTSSGTGGLELTGSAPVLKGKFGKEFNFGDIRLNNGNNGLSLATDVNVEDFAFLSSGTGKVNMGNYNLTASGSVSNASSDRYFYTAGNASDGGLTLQFEVPTTAATLATYHVGTSTTDYSTAVVKSFAEQSIATSGYFTVIPINNYHPSTTTPSEVLNYYWKTKVSGFDNLENNNIQLEFTSSENLKNLKVAYLDGVVWNIGNYKYKNGDHTLYFDNTANNAGYTQLINSDYTAGLDNGNGKIPIAGVKIYTSQGDYDWDSGSCWLDQDNDSGTPSSSDIAIIQASHTVTIPNGYSASASQVQIDGILEVNDGASGTIDIIKGSGTLVYEVNDNWTTYSVLNADHSDFLNNENATIELAGTGNPRTMPSNSSIAFYPNLRISGSNLVRSDTDEDLIINGNLTVESGTLSLLTYQSEVVEVGGDVVIGSGTLTFNHTWSDNRYMDVEGDITFTGTGTLNDNTSNGNIYLKGNINQTIGSINLTNSTLIFEGIESAIYSNTGGSASFNRIEINKSVSQGVIFNNEFSLDGLTDGATKALELTSGECHFNNASIDIDLTTGGNDFSIPSNSKLYVTAGTVNASGNSGIKLDGSLIVDGGTANIDGTLAGTGTSGSSYMAFTSSGDAYLEVSNSGTLNVGDQIRRSINAEEGVLTFVQNGGNVNIGTVGGDIKNTRGMFEILGTGSSFSQDGVDDVITIQRSNGSTTVPSLYFNPEATSFADGAGFTFDVSAVTGETFGIYAPQNLNDVTITGGTASGAGNGNEVKLLTNEHTISGNLSNGANATFNANGLDLTLNGNLTNNGTFTANNNTTYFEGTTDQTITGTTTFANLVKQIGSGNLILASDITVAGDLTLSSGSLDTDVNALTVNGDVVNDVSTISTDPGEGIVMADSDIQQISGSGSYSTLTINNGNGVVLPTQSGAINFSNKLRMENGVFDIGRNLLILDETATIEEVNSFSNSNMVQTNLSFTDNGIKKFFPEDPVDNDTLFVYPIGSLGKYTPVILDISENGNNTGSIRVKAADEPHISIPEADQGNVLQYNWTLDADGISGFSAESKMYSNDGDAPGDTSQYITARILLESTEWNKFSTSDFNGQEDANDVSIFTFSGTGDSGIDGDYTAGNPDAIPDQVPSYITVTDGDYSTTTTWATFEPSTGVTGTAGVDVPAGGPRGSLIYVDHMLSFPDDFEAAYRTYINETGIVDIGTSTGHRLGNVFGTGTLKLQSGNLPAGSYEDFFSPSGGILEFAGTALYKVLSETPNVNTVVFSGSGTRKLPNIDVQLYGDLEIDGPDVENTDNKNLSVQGDIIFNDGFFDAGITDGTEVPTVTLNGNVRQSISGTREFTDASGGAFYNLEVDNSSDVELLANVYVANDLLLTSGNIITSLATILTIDNTAPNAVIGGGTSSFVDGPMRKKINQNSSFEFPVGDASRYGNIVVSPVAEAGGFWQTQYYNASAQAITATYGTGVEWVSNNEYWEVTAPSAGLDAKVTMRFDGQSGVNEDNALIVEEVSNSWDEVSATVNAGSGTITSDAALTYDAFKYLSFGVASIAPYTWEGDDVTNPTDWFTSANWSSGLVPSAANPAIIDGTGETMPVISSGDAFCDNLTINANDTLTLTPGTSLEVVSNVNNLGTIVLESTNSSLSTLMLPPDADPQNPTTGDVNVKLTLEADGRWYLSSPIKNTRLDKFYPDNDTANDFVYLFRDETGRWLWHQINEAYLSTHTYLEKMENISANYKDEKTLDYTGEVYNQDVENDYPGTGYYLVGNPFPAAIDWEYADGWVREGFSNTIWSWITYNEERTIQTYNNNGDVLPGVWTIEPEGYDASTMSHIPPYQSVWMKKESADFSRLVVKREARVKESDAPLKSASANEASKVYDLLRVQAQNSHSRDGAVLYFHEKFNEGKNREDSEKRFNGSKNVPEVYTRMNNQALSINGLPTLEEESYQFPLSVRNRIEEDVTLQFNAENFSDDYDIFLEDRTKGRWINLKVLDSYAYTPTKQGDDHERFVIHIQKVKEVPTGIEEALQNENAGGIEINGYRNYALVGIEQDLLQSGLATVELFDLNGRLIFSSQTTETETRISLPGESGVYIVRVNVGGVVKTEKVVRQLGE